MAGGSDRWFVINGWKKPADKVQVNLLYSGCRLRFINHSPWKTILAIAVINLPPNCFGSRSKHAPSCRLLVFKVQILAIEESEIHQYTISYLLQLQQIPYSSLSLRNRAIIFILKSFHHEFHQSQNHVFDHGKRATWCTVFRLSSTQTLHMLRVINHISSIFRVCRPLCVSSFSLLHAAAFMGCSPPKQSVKTLYTWLESNCWSVLAVFKHQGCLCLARGV